MRAAVPEPPRRDETAPAADGGSDSRSRSGSGPADALAAARGLASRAEGAAKSRPGEAFKLAAEAFALASAHGDDPACAALAGELRGRLRTYAARANAGAAPSPSRTLVEE